MELLDLPPEIYQRIVRFLVKKHGLVEAWKIRGISKAFKTYITYEVLAAPSFYAYNKTRAGRDILRNNLADFLYVRSNTLNHFARPHVPNFIRDVMLVMKPWVIGDEATSKLRKALCELFVRNKVDALKCVLTDIYKLKKALREGISSPNTVTLIAAAVATGNVDALRHFSKESKESLSVTSPAFGYPLDAAVYVGHLGLVKVIAQQAITNKSHTVVDVKHAEHLSFRQAVCTGIECDRDEIVTHLIGKYLEAFGSITGPCMETWLSTAIVHRNSHVLQLLLTIPTQASESAFYDAFQTAFRDFKPALTGLFFSPSRNSLSINQVYGYTYPLLTAITTIKGPQHTKLFVKTLLKLGADANGPEYLAGLDRPLCVAWKREFHEAFLTLLEAGANPWLVFSAKKIRGIMNKHGKATEIGKALIVAYRKAKRLNPSQEDEGFLADVEQKL
ncbi:hypothetical protein G6011_02941 [Alternaria panax]|uniref:Uncharacterized protein n=1 Tax=Alternaria panax TaxID=48097 RepID=A0AAD4FAK9_9PLEO|nr:hypothetical protein G6011_02941 [Alternaria panax]